MSRNAREFLFSGALRERDCNIQEHLRNHVHLTNCIHLKNHVHMQKPKSITAESSLIRDLILLQRSKSLRDPSTSPSWNSPVGVSLMHRLEREETGYAREYGGVKSLGGHLRQGSRNSPLSQPGNLKAREKGSTSRVPPHIGRKYRGGIVRNARVAADNDRQILGDITRLEKETEKKDSYPSEKKDLYRSASETRSSAFHDGSSIPKTRKSSRKTGVSEGRKIFVQDDSGPSKMHTIASSQFQGHSTPQDLSSEEQGDDVVKQSSRVRKRKSSGPKRPRAYPDPKDFSVSSSSLIHGSSRTRELSGSGMHPRSDELGVTQSPKNGCGIPWNWSRIHQRGKTILDRAGKSLSCGLSDSAARKMEGLGPHCSYSSHTDASVIPGSLENSASSVDSDMEALPLLNEPCLSHESLGKDGNNAGFSGELGLYADHNFNSRKYYYHPHSEMELGRQMGHRESLMQTGFSKMNGRHKSLSQKYAPKRFDELVGQNLVVQALKNAIQRGKIGIVYVFYGPHGTGKTSCARIFAAALNCYSPIPHKPCGSCDACLAEQSGESPCFKEISSMTNLSSESISDLVDTLILTSSGSYKVLIIDDCHTLAAEAWKAISKLLDQVPQNIVFILIATCLDQVPHTIITRSQKFFFPKMKDTDIIKRIQFVANKEVMEIDRDALKLIASKSDGSLRDAEMTLDQLSLLGQRISLQLVQELVGLIPDEKLVDLLDLALSADTINTVKCLRELVEGGVEPLALMSQLATLITDILAGSYVFPDGGHRKFFHRETLSKERMERLRQALKTLSEAEKQLRLASDRTTWLTAALLQLAPDHTYQHPNSSAGTSGSQTPSAQNDAIEQQRSEKSIYVKGKQHNGHNWKRHESVNSKQGITVAESSNASIPQKKPTYSIDINEAGSRQFICRSPSKLVEIWDRVLEKVHSNSLKNFMHAKGKLFSVSFGAVPTARITFYNEEDKRIAEKSRTLISDAFQLALGCPVQLQIDVMFTGIAGSSKAAQEGRSDSGKAVVDSSNSKAEITETFEGRSSSQKRMENAWLQEEQASPQLSTFGPHRADKNKKSMGNSKSQALVKGKVSLGHVLRQADFEFSRYPTIRSNIQRGMSIAEKLEQENLRLESRSGGLLCWRTARASHRKRKHSRTQIRKSRYLLKLVVCAKCPCIKKSR